MNRIFVALVAIAFAAAAWSELKWEPPPEAPEVEESVGPPEAVPGPLWEELERLRGRIEALEEEPAPARPPMSRLTDAMLDAASGSVELALSLIGVMTLFLGLMKVAEAGGLLTIIAKLVRPLMIRLFPDVPPDHPAMGAMIMNMSANALGLGNAATPFGIRAMQELDRLNPRRGTATDAMALFLAINTSSVTLLPTGVIAIRDAMGSGDPAGILSTTLFATLCSTTVALIGASFYKRFSRLEPLPEGTQILDEAADHSEESEKLPEDLPQVVSEAYPLWVSVLALCTLVAGIPLALIFGSAVSPWIIPGLMLGFILFGWARGVAVYETFVSGARDGFQVAVTIIPYLVAILVAVAMLRASGALDWFVTAVGPVTGALGLPAEALPMALLRPLSGSGAMGVMMATMEEHGPDSYVGYLVSTLQGSTETTFYVLAVYFGAVQVQRMRHSLATALTADLAGIIGSVAAVQIYFAMNGLW